jgi:hypothetical protein
MKVTKLALAAAFALASTVALAQTNGQQTTGTEGYGSVVAPSMGSYQTSVGASNIPPTWRNTGPAASVPRGSAYAQNPTGRGIRR